MRTLLTWLGLGTLALAWPSPAGAQPVGSEFRINTYTTGSEQTLGRSVAADANGNFVVVWSSISPGNSGTFGQRYDSDGTALGAEFGVSTHNNYGTSGASTAASAEGDFVVVWTSYDGGPESEGLSAGVSGQRFDGSGEPQGEEFQVNTFTTHHQADPDVAVDASGNFVVVWRSAYQDGGNPGVFGQRYDGAGLPQGAEFRINSYTTQQQAKPAVASDVAGNFVVVWNSVGQDGSGEGVFGQRFDSAGNPRGAEFRVNSYTTNDQEEPFVVSDVAGNFVVVWTGRGGDSFGGIFGQRYDSTGNKLGGEFHVNSYTTGTQRAPAVALDESGSFVVVWQSYGGNDGSGYGVFGQRYDSGGVAQGQEFQVNSYTTGWQRYPSVGATGPDQFVVVWSGQGEGGEYDGIFGQRFDFSGGTSTIHVGDLDRRAKNVGAMWRAQVTTLVHDDAHSPLAGVFVIIDVSGVGPRSCTTTASGLCEVSVLISDSVASLTFSVTNLLKTDFLYTPAANHDPDPDSDGTVIVVNQP